MDTATMTQLFQSGRLRHVHWDAVATKYARLCLPSILDLTRLQLLELDYATPDCFGALMRLLAQTDSLRVLRMEQEDFNSLLPRLANTAWLWWQHSQQQLDQLELVLTGRPLDHIAARSLRDIIKIPQESLTISFNSYQDDYSRILSALRQGLDDLEAVQKPLPVINFRRVTVRSHERLLNEFAVQVRASNVLSGLQLHPFSHVPTHQYTDCRVDANFFAALSVLLQADNLKDLEITHIEAGLELRHDHSQVFEELRQALARNTSLLCLALRSTRGLQELWTQAIFPALTTNRTLQRLEFAHVHTTAVTRKFLELLPHMQGLRHVQAPGRQTFGRLWLDRLKRLQEPTDLSVEFSLGAFSSTVFTEFEQIEQILRRNRLWVQALKLIQESETRDMIQAIADFGQEDQGLSAVYGVLRSCLWLFS